MPPEYPFLETVNEEMDAIYYDIFDQTNPFQQEYEIDRAPSINRDNFSKLLLSGPDIVHFTGHGESKGLVFQDGNAVDYKKLAELFRNSVSSEKPIQVLFLNACYSSSQIKELIDLVKKKYIGFIITNNNQISEILAKNFAISFFKNYKINRDVPKAFYHAYKEYNLNYPNKEYNTQEIYPDDKFLELKESRASLSPIDQTIDDNDVKLVQKLTIPDYLIQKIDSSITTFEDISISNDSAKFRSAIENLSSILSWLLVYSHEYVSNFDPEKIHEQKRFVDDIIIYLDKKKLLLTRSQRREKIEKNK